MAQKNQFSACSLSCVKGFLSLLCVAHLLTGCGGMASGMLAGALLGASVRGLLVGESPQGRVWIEDEHATLFRMPDREGLPETVRIVVASRSVPSMAKIGCGEKLALVVIDKRREEDLLGYWRAGNGEIRASNSLATVTRESFRKGLSDLGFEVLDSPMTAMPTLEITIQTFEYWVAYYVNVDAQVETVLYGGEGQLSQTNYTNNNRFDTPWFSNRVLRDSRWIEDKINSSISDLISKILTDPELLVVLKQNIVREKKCM